MSSCWIPGCLEVEFDNAQQASRADRQNCRRSYRRSGSPVDSSPAAVICEVSNMCRCTCILPVRVYQYRGNKALQAIVSPFLNGSGKHDCIVSLSGRRDSSYVLAYTFVNELKLGPFALTVDNGFMPHESMQNIDNAVRILGVKYRYVRQTATIGSLPPCRRSKIGQTR